MLIYVTPYYLCKPTELPKLPSLLAPPRYPHLQWCELLLPGGTLQFPQVPLGQEPSLSGAAGQGTSANCTSSTAMLEAEIDFFFFLMLLSARKKIVHPVSLEKGGLILYKPVDD